jgi:hypothetical protein
MTQVVKTSVAEQVKSVTEKLEKLQTIHETVYKTGSSFTIKGFSNSIQTETKIENLIKMTASTVIKATEYVEAAEKVLGLSNYPVYKENGFTDEEIISDIKLRIAIITTESKRNDLLEIKRGFEELMDKEDKMALLMQKIQNI